MYALSDIMLMSRVREALINNLELKPLNFVITIRSITACFSFPFTSENLIDRSNSYFGKCWYVLSEIRSPPTKFYSDEN